MRLIMLFRKPNPGFSLPGAAAAGLLCGLLVVAGDVRIIGAAGLTAGGMVLHRLYRYDLEAMNFDALIVLLPVMLFVGFGGFKINAAVSDALLPNAVLILLAGVVKRGARRSPAGDLLQPVAYGFFLVLTVTASLYKNLLLSGRFEPAGAVNLVKMFVNIVYFFLFLAYFRKEEYRERFFPVWTGTAVAFSGLGIAGVCLYFLGRDTRFTLAYRLMGTVTDPNLAASYLLVSLGIAVLANTRAGRPPVRPNTLLIGTALLLTASRGGIAGLAAGGLVLLGINAVLLQSRRLLGAVLGLAAIVVLLFFAGDKLAAAQIILDRLAGAADPAEAGSRVRLLLWSVAIRVGLQEPLLGAGPMRFAAAASELLGLKITNIPHNTYLGFFAETGILGLAALLWFPALLAGRLGRQALGGDAPAAFLLFPLSGVAVQAFTINAENLRFVWILLALICVWTEEPTPAAGTESAGKPPPVPLRLGWEPVRSGQPESTGEPIWERDGDKNAEDTDGGVRRLTYQAFPERVHRSPAAPGVRGAYRGTVFRCRRLSRRRGGRLP